MRIEFLFLFSIQFKNFLKRQIFIQKPLSIVYIKKFAIKFHAHFVIWKIVIGQRKTSLFLSKKHLQNTASDCIDHIQIDHCSRKERIAVIARRIFGFQNIFYASRNEIAAVAEDQIAIFVLLYSDPSSFWIILMSDSVIQRLADNVRVVLQSLFRKNRVSSHVTVCEIADFCLNFLSRNNERAVKMLIIPHNTVTVFQDPGDLTESRNNQIRRFRLPKKQDRRVRDLAFACKSRIIQKGRIAPPLDIRSKMRILFGIHFPSKQDRLFWKMFYRSVWNDLRTPVIRNILGADPLDFFDTQPDKSLAVTPVIHSFECNRHSARSSRNLKNKDPFVFSKTFVDLDKSQISGSLLSHFFFQSQQRLVIISVICPDNIVLFVFHTKNEPRIFFIVEVSFVTQSWKIFPEIIKRKIILSFLKFDGLRFVFHRKKFIQLLIDIEIHLFHLKFIADFETTHAIVFPLATLERG